MNGRSEKVVKKKMFDPAVGKVWPPLPEDREFEGRLMFDPAVGKVWPPLPEDKEFEGRLTSVLDCILVATVKFLNISEIHAPN